MFKLIREFFSENGQGSSKRWIAISIAGVLGWGIIYALVRASTDSARQALINSTMIFVLVLSGVATVAQIASIFKGTPFPKDDTPPSTTTTTTETKTETT
jgi:hypothetical protein